MLKLKGRFLAASVAAIGSIAFAGSVNADNISVQSRPNAVTPPNLVPVRQGGMVIFVTNLEAQKDWYEKVLGMKVVRTYERDGKLFEYIMSYGDQDQVVALNANGRPVGPQIYARLLLRLPNPKELGDYLYSQGVNVRRSSDRTYVITDPEGNTIEISNPPPREGVSPITR